MQPDSVVEDSMYSKRTCQQYPPEIRLQMVRLVKESNRRVNEVNCGVGEIIFRELTD